MAEAETIDTSGSIGPDLKAGLLFDFQWDDLSPFAQGYITALLCLRRKGCDCCEGRGEIGGHTGQTPESFVWVTEPCPACVPGFSDLAPEALALILSDCEAAKARLMCNAGDGGWFWSNRQAGRFDPFPPLRVYLDDAGKVRLSTEEAQ